MSYAITYRNYPSFWVYYRGTSNGLYIRAKNHQQAKEIFAEQEGLLSLAYVASKKNRL